MRAARSLFIILFVLLSLSLRAQNSYPKTLLWRISGNGLSKPSYLFGTIHLTDKKLFRFSDSVYKAIERTEGFAIEINPDEMAAFYMNNLFEEMQKTKKLSDYLDEAELKKYEKPLSKKFNKPAKDITAKEILKEKNKWMSEYMEKGEMPTIVDAYLYNLARKQGKWVGGIEDLGDQLTSQDAGIDRSDIVSVANNTDNEDKNSERALIAKLMAMYAAEDLPALAKALGSDEIGEKDSVFIRRNKKMVRRIDSLSAIRDMFFAIGSAHLPGDSGVIELLRRKGFTVTPVMPVNKRDPGEYKVKEVKREWQELKNPGGTFTAMLPGNPAKVKLYGLIDMHFYFDIFNLAAYVLMSVPMNFDPQYRDSIYEATAQRAFPGKKGYRGKRITQNGIEGMEYIDSVDQSKIRMRIILYNKQLYMCMMTGVNRNTLYNEDAAQFFAGFSINKNATEKPVQYYTFHDSIMGLHFVSPLAMEKNDKLANGDKVTRISSFTGVDNSTGLYILLFSKEMQRGYTLNDDSTIQQNTIDALKTEYKKMTVRNIPGDGSSYMYFEAPSEQRRGSYIRGVSMIKHNRNILLMVVGDSATTLHGAADTVFRSVKFPEPCTMPWARYRSPEGSFTTWAPALFSLRAEGDLANQFISYDTTTSSSYLVLTDTLSKYEWYNTEGNFWKAYLEKLDTTGVEHSAMRDVTNNELSGKEFIIVSKTKGGYAKRMRMLLSGNIVYKLMYSDNPRSLYDSNINRFFNEFAVDHAGSKEWITSSKITSLMNDLSAEDRNIRYTASAALEKSTSLQSIDTAVLYKGLFSRYQSVYDTIFSNYINVVIGEKLLPLDSSHIANRLVESYHQFIRQGREDMKAAIIAILAKSHTRHSFMRFSRPAHYFTSTAID